MWSAQIPIQALSLLYWSQAFSLILVRIRNENTHNGGRIWKLGVKVVRVNRIIVSNKASILKPNRCSALKISFNFIWHCLADFGRYLLFVSFKKLISIPTIQSCNICNEIIVSTRPIATSQIFILNHDNFPKKSTSLWAIYGFSRITVPTDKCGFVPNDYLRLSPVAISQDDCGYQTVALQRSLFLCNLRR